MGRALAMHLRSQIIQERSKGKKLVDIAREKQLSYSTLRNIWKRYKAGGAKALVYGCMSVSSQKQVPCFTAPWSNVVHDIWQIDAKEQLHLSSGENVCYLTIVDEKPGCLLMAYFPPTFISVR
jgi:hypothetical protein